MATTAINNSKKAKKPSAHYMFKINPIWKVIIVLIMCFGLGAGLTFSFKSYIADYHASKAEKHIKSKQWTLATEHARHAADLLPGNAAFHNLLAGTLEQQANETLERNELLTMAGGQLQQAITLNPFDADYWINLARVSEKSENSAKLFPRANIRQNLPSPEECLHKAMSLGPNNVYIMISAAAYYARKGDLKQAEDLIDKAWKTSPYSTGRYYISWKHRQENLDNIVENYLSKQLPLRENDPQLLCWLGELYEVRKNYDSAQAIYKMGLKTERGKHFQGLIARVLSKMRKK